MIGPTSCWPQAGGDKPQKPAAASISGRVVDLAGAPIAKARVSAEVGSSEIGQTPRSYVVGSTADGTFTLGGLDAGKYQIVVERSGYLREVFESRTSGAWIALTPGQEMTDIVVRLTREASLTGRILDEDHDPVANVSVKLFRFTHHVGLRRAEQFGFGETDSTGAFRLTGIGPGRYYLVAIPRQTLIESSPLASGEKIQYGYIPTYYGGSAEASGAAPIVIAPGESATAGDLTLRKARIVHIRGRVNADAFSGDLARTIVVHADPDDERSGVGPFGEPSARVSKTDGTFDIVATPGQYILVVTPSMGRMKILGQESLTVAETDVENVVVSLLSAEVEGNFVYADPKPSQDKASQSKAPDVASSAALPRVLLLPDGPEATSHASQAVKNGSFSIRDVSPGRYQVRIAGLPPDVYLQGIRSDGGEDLMSTDLDLTRGGRRVITVTLSRSAATLDGSVVDDDGKPLPDIIVTLAPKHLDARQAHRYLRSVSNESGHFTMVGLPPGDYCLYTWKELADGDEFDDELLQREAGRCTSAELQEKGNQNVQLTFEPLKSPGQ